MKDIEETPVGTIFKSSDEYWKILGYSKTERGCYEAVKCTSRGKEFSFKTTFRYSYVDKMDWGDNKFSP